MSFDELTLVTFWADGRVEPQIPSGTPVILIQNGAASPAKFIDEKGELWDYYLQHPKNADEVDLLALQYITKYRPDFLENENSTVVLCPEDIASKMIWE